MIETDVFSWPPLIPTLFQSLHKNYFIKSATSHKVRIVTYVQRIWDYKESIHILLRFPNIISLTLILLSSLFNFLIDISLAWRTFCTGKFNRILSFSNRNFVNNTHVQHFMIFHPTDKQADGQIHRIPQARSTPER